ncbi:hypothetical protein CCH79_00005497 [Gambusia affinis]|uniref:Uncharacterized protein n=1 Tax=Gambusia affinis TaxID=33528 RepID=A0A315V6V6_GAMAF|nr:hypothetical protein CCH79_00005497 [Gambusia affinis]
MSVRSGNRTRDGRVEDSRPPNVGGAMPYTTTARPSVTFGVALFSGMVDLTEHFLYISMCGDKPPASCWFSQVCDIGCFMFLIQFTEKTSRYPSSDQFASFIVRGVSGIRDSAALKSEGLSKVLQPSQHHQLQFGNRLLCGITHHRKLPGPGLKPSRTSEGPENLLVLTELCFLCLFDFLDPTVPHQEPEIFRLHSLLCCRILSVWNRKNQQVCVWSMLSWTLTGFHHSGRYHAAAICERTLATLFFLLHPLLVEQEVLGLWTPRIRSASVQTRRLRVSYTSLTPVSLLPWKHSCVEDLVSVGQRLRSHRSLK